MPYARLGDVADVHLGKMLDRKKQRVGKALPYLRNVNVRWGHVDTSDLLNMVFRPDELERFGLKKGDVLVCEGGEPGRAAVWNGDVPDVKYQKALHRVRFLRPFIPRFFVFYMEHTAKYGGLERRFTGSTISHLTLEAFKELPVPVLPEAVQERVLAEIEKQFTRLDAGVGALKSVKAKLKRYRAAVLKAACEGRVVETEASIARRERRSYETGAELLTRIQADRRRARESHSEKRTRHVEPLTAETSELPSLPAGWCWASLGQLSWASSYGTSAKCSYEQTGPPVLRIPNIAAGQIDLTDLKFARSVEGFDLDNELAPGDLLIIRTNGSRSLIGRSALVREAFSQPTTFASYLIRFRLVPEASLAAWVKTIWDYPFLRAWIEGHASTSAGQHNISMTVLNNLPVPLPPLAEQHRIVAEVERRLSVVDELETMVNANLQRAARLRQSVLQAAFSGNLVAAELGRGLVGIRGSG